MASVYTYVNFRFTKTVSLNIKLLRSRPRVSLPCLFIPFQEKSTVTGIRLIGEILFPKKAGEEKKVTRCSYANSQLKKLDSMMPFSVYSQRLLFLKNKT